MDVHQKCVSNLAATVVRQDQQIRDLKSHIRLLESTPGRRNSSGGSSSTMLHDRTPSEVLSDSTATESSCTSDGSFPAMGSSSKESQAALWSSLEEAEEEMRSVVMESKRILSAFKARKRRSGHNDFMYD